MLGPDARQQAAMIEAEFVRAGFTIYNRHSLSLTEEQAQYFFSDKVQYRKLCRRNASQAHVLNTCTLNLRVHISHRWHDSFFLLTGRRELLE
jgi:hypothetical protein